VIFNIQGVAESKDDSVGLIWGCYRIHIKTCKIGIKARPKLGSAHHLAAIAEIHLQSLGKIERGMTTKLSSHSKSGLASALQVPMEYLEAVCRGTSVVAVSKLKFCAPCWTPGTPPDPLWMEVRAKHCFLCGSKLRDSCNHCHETITSLKHRFCPFRGTPYKSEVISES
jgi:hypothetical protein